MDGQRILALKAPTPEALSKLESMHLADAPDYTTAIMAGLAHGLTPRDALHGAWGKWMTDHAESIQKFELANFYDGPESSKAMVNYSRFVHYLVVMVAEQDRHLLTLREELDDIKATLKQLTK